MSEIVYDIQKAQGTNEHTQDPEPFNPVPMMEAGFSGMSQALSSLGRPSGSGSNKKDYAPLVQALNNYRDTVQARQVSPAYQQNLWDSLTEWAASQGYTHSEIDGYASTTNTSVPNTSLKAYVQDKQDTKDAQQKALRERAKVNYPDLNPDKAMELELLDMSESMNISSIGMSSQGMPSEIARALVNNNMGMLERYTSRRIDEILRNAGGPVSSADLTTAVNQTVGELIANGLNAEHIAYLESYMYNLYEPMTIEGNKRLDDISKSFEDREKIAAHDRNMKEIQNGLLMAELKGQWLRTPVTFTAKENAEDPGTQMTMTGAQIALVTDIAPDYFTLLFNENPGTVAKITQSLRTSGGLSSKEMTPSEALVFTKKQYVDAVDSSPNDASRRNGAASQMNGYSTVLKDILGGPVNPRSRASDMLKIIANNIKLKAEDYQSSDEQILSNRDTAMMMLQQMGRAIGNEMNNSLPLFNDKGELRMYLINRGYDPSSSSGDSPMESQKMYSEDITEGYSMFGDRNTFDRYFKTGVPAALNNLSNATGWSVKELQEFFNDAMVRYSITGRDIVSNTQTRGRHFNSTPGFNLTEPLTDEQVSYALDIARSDNRNKAREYRDTRETSSEDWLVNPENISYEAPAQASPFVGPDERAVPQPVGMTYEEMDKFYEEHKDSGILKILYGDDWYEKYKESKKKHSQGSEATTEEQPNQDLKRGIRNNNPGNLRKSGDNWKGMNGYDEDNFVVFDTMEDGIRALSRDIRSKVDRGLNTYDKLLKVYAPPKENDTESYIKDVAQKTNHGRNKKISKDMVSGKSNLKYFVSLIRAVISHESGNEFEKSLSDDTIISAIKDGLVSV